MNQEQLRKEAAEKYTNGIAKYGSLDSYAFTNREVNQIASDNSHLGFEAGTEWEAEREKWIEVGHPTNLNYPSTQPFESIDVLTYGYDNEYVANFVDGEFYDKQRSTEFGEAICISTHITHWQYITPPKTSKQ